MENREMISMKLLIGFAILSVCIVILIAIMLSTKKFKKETTKQVLFMAFIILAAILVVLSIIIDWKISQDYAIKPDWDKYWNSIGLNKKYETEEEKQEAESIEYDRPEGTHYFTTIDGKKTRLRIYMDENYMWYVATNKKGEQSTENLEVGDMLSRDTDIYEITVINIKNTDEYYIMLNSSETLKIKDEKGTEFKEIRDDSNWEQEGYVYGGMIETKESSYTIIVNDTKYTFVLKE